VGLHAIDQSRIFNPLHSDPAFFSPAFSNSGAARGVMLASAQFRLDFAFRVIFYHKNFKIYTQLEEVCTIFLQLECLRIHRC